MSHRRVVVAGGGITGLATAFRLLRAGRDAAGLPLAVTVLEARARLGGNILTERRGGCVLDGGPDAFVAAHPAASLLCKELGLGDRLVSTAERNRRVYVYRGGVLHPVPEELLAVAEALPTLSTGVLPLARSGLFSWRGKARMGLDIVLPRRRATEDESVGHFIRRRLGQEALERLGEPLLGGIHASSVDVLSLAATQPQLLEAERRHGSLVRGALAQPAAAAPPSTFLSLAGGMGELVDALARAVEAAGGAVRIGAEVEAVTAGIDGDRLSVRIAGDAEAIPADDVVLCTPAHAAADALDGLDRDLSARLREIPYVSTATVAVGYARVDVPRPLDASAILVPRTEKRRALAVTFTSSNWAGRSPDDVALFRVLLGGDRDPGVLTRDDAELVSTATGELEALLGIHARPLLTRVFRWERATAQPCLGHPERLRKIRAAARRHPGLHLAGAAFDGAGILDCVRQANAVAKGILEVTKGARPARRASLPEAF